MIKDIKTSSLKVKKEIRKLKSIIQVWSHPPVTESQVSMAAGLAGSVFIRFSTRDRIDIQLWELVRSGVGLVVFNNITLTKLSHLGKGLG